MTPIQDLTQLNVHATFDEEACLIFVTYSGELTPASTRAYYKWMLHQVGPLIDNVRGIIVDFREVKRIPPVNALTVLHASREMHTWLDTSHLSVALLVRDQLQEQLVRIATRMTYNQANKQLVHSMAEALAFIENHAEAS